MSSRIAIAHIALAALAACESTGGSGGGAKVAESGTAKGSAGGFSAVMSSELARAGIGEPTLAPPPAPAPEAAGSAAAPAGSAAAPPTGSATAAPAGSAAAPPAGSAVATTEAPPTKADAPPQTTPAPAASEPAAATQPPAKQSAAIGATSAKAIGAVKAPPTRAYVKPGADLAAIKLDLEPNWERDMGEAGTFSLVVKLPGTNDTRLFSVRYGYEDSSAPMDCEAYKKFLEDRSMMKVSLHRQRGAACYIEGSDQGGTLAFRFLLTYGGKRLMCHGSLYKDGASSALGDLRDKVLLQAKKICETLAL